MGKKSGPSVPTPDPVAIANAQSASNIATAEAQQKLNMVGATGPTGTVNYVADPTQPGGYRQVTTLNDAEQRTYDQSKFIENAALGIAQNQLPRVDDALSQKLNADGLPALTGGGGIVSSFDKGGPLQYTFDPGQAVQGQIGGDLDAARYQQIAATYGQAASRLDPRFDKAQQSLETKLANQGLSQNSDAYINAQDQFGREKNDAYNQAAYSAIGAGEDAANALFNRQAAQGQFANQAAAQMYGQNQGTAAFNNATAGQDYSQNLGAAQFQNNAVATQAQLDNAARSQGLQERAYIQNQPINQLTGLLSLGQVGQPQGISYQPSQVAPTDVTGAYALQAQAQQAAAQRAAQANSGLMSGLFSLGSAALLSDRRLKTDIQLLRRRKDGVGVYRYRFKSGGPPQIGVIAQEVRRIRPDLVMDRSDGYMAVFYDGLGAL